MGLILLGFKQITDLFRSNSSIFELLILLYLRHFSSFFAGLDIAGLVNCLSYRFFIRFQPTIIWSNVPH